MSRSESDETKQLNIALVSDPVGKAGIEILTGILSIFQELCHNIYVIIGNFPEDRFPSTRMHIKNVKGEKGIPRWSRTLAFLSRQLKLSIGLAKVLGKIDIVVAVGLSPILPVLLAKISRKKVVKVAAASLQQQAELDFGRRSPLYHLSIAVERLIYALSDRIITLTPLGGLGLDRYRRKISYAPLSVDTALFKPIKGLNRRENIIVYIGRLEEVKGVMNLVEAVPLVMRERQDVRFIIGGDGTLLDKVKQGLKKNNSEHKTTLTGWIPHHKLPDYLNELKLLILPSYSEGLPVMVLEAMSCGTPLLVTPVGGVPEVIKDGSTGFILPHNSPDCIAQNIIRALEYPALDQIASNARHVIEEEYTFEAVLKRYRDLFSHG